eukprot:Skav232656  [mRNA]  locus=scaffold698:51246:54002:+ [translate_table: standard]
MDAINESGLVLSVCAGVVLLLTLIKLLVLLFPQRKDLWKGMELFMKGLWFSQNPLDEGHIFRRICIERTWLARKLVWYILFWSCGGLLSFVAGYGSWKSMAGHWVSLFRAGIFLAMVQSPRLITPGKLDLIYIVLQLTVVLDLLPLAAPSENLVLINFLGFLMLSFPACVCARYISVVAVGQGGIFAVVLLRCLSEFPSNNDAVVMGASSLMNLTCDAVVELDDSLKLMSPCPKLSTMLLGRGAGLKGTSFTDFVASSDAERAAEILLSTSENNGTAHAFHTHLVDSCCSKFRTEVFQVKYWMANGKQCHLLGLREFTDLKSLAGNATDAIPDEHRAESGKARSSGTKQRQEAFLVLDMEERVVDGASAPFSQLTGLGLEEVFSGEIISELEEIQQKAKSVTKTKLGTNAIELSHGESSERPELLSDEATFFKSMPLHMNSTVVDLAGLLKIYLSRLGQLQIILCCKAWEVSQKRIAL